MAVLAGPFVADQYFVLEVLPDPLRVKTAKVDVELAVVSLDRKAHAGTMQEIRRGGKDDIAPARSPPPGREPGDGYGGRVALDGRMKEE